MSSSSEFVELKIEEFLQVFGHRLSSLSRDAFRSQVRALIQLKQCEDAHLGEEVERHWFEVVTQQYVFTRLSKEVRTTHIQTEAYEHAHFLDLQLQLQLRVFEASFGPGPGSGPGPCSGPGCDWLHVLLLQVEALKQVTQEELLSWFQEQRHCSRKLSVHVSDL